ncbi:uncharacterized protein [Euwallacea fornicatus]|uniref:uncharacterized protein n=1 Tax=Euwallacea fornicatus TaxID=995702 RepID=UPI00338D8656
MVYSTAERVEIIELFFVNGKCANQAVNVFNQRYGDKHVSRKHPVRNEAVEVGVLGHMVLEPITSTRQLATSTGISATSICRILKSHKFHPYKIKLVQELNEDDFDRRLHFCELISQRATENHNFIFNICFSDEASFSLNGIVNRHNCRYWSDINPHIFHEAHTQHPQKLNVWAGIFGDHIIGPYFIPGNLTDETYLQLLEDFAYPQLVDLVENNPDYSENLLTFQQDGAPPHYALAVRQFLNENFPSHWIGRRDPIEWPARSPDLTPLDFFFWGHLKSKVYSTPPGTLEILRERIVNECR